MTELKKKRNFVKLGLFSNVCIVCAVTILPPFASSALPCSVFYFVCHFIDFSFRVLCVTLLLGGSLDGVRTFRLSRKGSGAQIFARLQIFARREALGKGRICELNLPLSLEDATVRKWRKKRREIAKSVEGPKAGKTKA